MKRKYNLRELTPIEVQRFQEIEFYLNIKHIFGVCGEQLATYEMIEAMCRLCDASITLIKTLTSNINAINSQVRPFKDELVVMLYRTGAPLRQIEKTAKVSTRTIYRFMDMYQQESDKEYFPRVKEEYFPHIQKFNKLVKELMPYDGHII